MGHMWGHVSQVVVPQTEYTSGAASAYLGALGVLLFLLN